MVVQQSDPEIFAALAKEICSEAIPERSSLANRAGACRSALIIDDSKPLMNRRRRPEIHWAVARDCIDPLLDRHMHQRS
jgi:hypothetical protein